MTSNCCKLFISKDYCKNSEVELFKYFTLRAQGGAP